MITKRDRELLKFIDEYGYITIEQAKVLFFNDKNLGTGYEMARRRLSMLVDEKQIKVAKLQANNKNIYYGLYDSKPSYHNVTVVDCLCKLVEIGAKIRRFDRNKSWLDGDLISDAYCECEFGDYLYAFIFEVCYMHKTIPIRKYRTLYSEFRQNDLRPRIVKINLIDSNKQDYKDMKGYIVDIDYEFNQFAKIFLQKEE